MSIPPTDNLIESIAENLTFHHRGSQSLKGPNPWMQQDHALAMETLSPGLSLEVDGSPPQELKPTETLIVPEFITFRVLRGEGTLHRFRLRAFKTVDLCQLFPVAFKRKLPEGLLANLESRPGDSLSLSLTKKARGFLFAAEILKWDEGLGWSLPMVQNLGRLSPALHLMERHFGENLTREQLASSCGWAPSRFHQIFHDTLRVSPMAWLRRYRLQRARAHLRTGAGSITSIAHRCGFPDAFHFSRSFKQVYGCSPSAFKSGAIPTHPTQVATVTNDPKTAPCDVHGKA